MPVELISSVEVVSTSRAQRMQRNTSTETMGLESMVVDDDEDEELCGGLW